MAGVYDRLRGAAVRLLDRFDQEGTQAVITVTVNNPDPLLPPSVVDEPLSIRAVVSGIKAELVSAAPDLTMTDLKVITAHDGAYVPKAGQRVLIDGRNRAIIRVEPIPASGAPCAYRFYVR